VIRNILVGLDPSRCSAAAVELGIAWAKRFDAEVVGAAVIDEPGIGTGPAIPIGGGQYKKWIDDATKSSAEREAARLVGEFEARCAAAVVRFLTRTVRGDPVRALLGLHEDFDVTLLGRETRFRFATQDGPDDTLTEVLRQARRPIVAVPERPADEGPIVVAYDGSEASVDALESFADTGLGAGRAVTVTTVDEDPAVADRLANEAVRFLAHHDIPATPMSVAADRDEAALDAAVESAGAGMVVMGAFSGSRRWEWADPSTTTRMLERPGRLLFMCHHPS
jgi:nucleotide-binding universal stress UspA family protein